VIPTEPDNSAHADRPFQFRVRTLLSFIAVVSVLLAILRWHPTFGAILTWTLLIVAAHVIATAWGTRHNRRYDAKTQANILKEDQLAAGGYEIRFAPTTRLHHRSRLGWLTIGCVVVGASLGGTLGSWTLMTVYEARLSWPAFALGAVSASILGGLLGFLLSTFLNISLRAWREAIAAPMSKTPISKAKSGEATTSNAPTVKVSTGKPTSEHVPTTSGEPTSVSFPDERQD
jgi:hypothetical protein